MSFIKSFEKTALIPMTAGMEDVYDEGAKKYYEVTHSPLIHGSISALRFGLPSAALTAIVSPKGLKTRNSLVAGALLGGLAGITTAADKKYKNMLEKAHVNYHLEN